MEDITRSTRNKIESDIANRDRENKMKTSGFAARMKPQEESKGSILKGMLQGIKSAGSSVARGIMNKTGLGSSSAPRQKTNDSFTRGALAGSMGASPKVGIMKKAINSSKPQVAMPKKAIGYSIKAKPSGPSTMYNKLISK